MRISYEVWTWQDGTHPFGLRFRARARRLRRGRQQCATCADPGRAAGSSASSPTAASASASATPAGDYDELVATALATAPQVLVTDIRMPPTFVDEGIEAAKEVRRRLPGTGPRMGG